MALVGDGFNVIGHLTSRTGLGAATRMTWSLIERNGWDSCALDLEIGGARVQASTRPIRMGSFDDLPFSVNLLHMNPLQIMDGLLTWRPELIPALTSRAMVTVPYWELPVMPAMWGRVLRATDLVLAPTLFIKDAVASTLSDMGGTNPPEVVHFMQAAPVPSRPARNREMWFAERAGTCVFLASFDFSSDANRKNPWAVLESFQEAFGSRDDVTLVFKTGRASDSRAAASARRLEDVATGDARIVLVDQMLSDAEMASLIASADIYVSLHRSEGLGLGMMEAMASGVPVVATGWSGNMDFMDKTNSIPLGFERVGVVTDYHPEYRAVASRAWWAEARRDDAVAAMRALADDQQKRIEMGFAARASMLRRWERYERGTALRTAMDLARHPSSPAVRSEKERRLRRDVLARRAHRRILMTGAAALRVAHLRPPRPADAPPPGPMRLLDPNRLD